MPDGTLVAATCGLGAAIAWGVADFLGAQAVRTLHPVRAACGVQLLGTAAFAIIYLLILRPRVDLNLEGTLYSTAAGMLVALGLAAFYAALRAGPVSLVSPLGAAYPLVTTAVAIACFAARPTPWQLAGVALIVIGVSICSGLADAGRGQARISVGVRWGLVTVMLWGVAFALLDQGVGHLGWETATLFQAGAGAIAFAFVLPFVRQSSAVRFAGILGRPHVIGAGVILLLGNVVFNVGLTSATATGVVPVTALSASYPALTIVLAIRHLDETLGRGPLVGALLTIVGAVTLSAS